MGVGREELESISGGRYQIEGFLAEGGMGTVYTARVRSLGSRVAIKVLAPEVASSNVRLARFRQEAALAANLSHPNIVPVFEFDATPDLAYLVMPYVEGQTLAAQLAEKRQLDYPAVRNLIGQVGDALSFAHQNRVVHRDIKPANLIQEKSTGRWLVTDFGIAHTTRSKAADITQTGTVIGTPTYMAPEQAIGGHVDARADLYSLAAVALQALCGLSLEMLGDLLVKGPQAIEKQIRASNPRMKPALAAALAWPLDPLKEERPESAEAWLEAIRDAEGARALYRWSWVAVLVAVSITLWLFVFQPRLSTSEPTTPAVAVPPVQMNVPDDPRDLETIISELFDWQLQYVPDLQVLGRGWRQEIQSRYGTTPQDLNTLIALARERGATEVLWGRAESQGDSLKLSIRVYDADNGRAITDADADGPVDSLSALVSDIVREAFAERLLQQVSGWASASPRGLEAINKYVQAMRDSRHGSYDRAVEGFEEVIGLDSAFAPAYFHRMLALIFKTRQSQYSLQIGTALEAASAYRDSLDPVSRELLRGYETLIRVGDISGAEQAALEIVDRYPKAVDAQFLLGYIQFNFRALLGGNPGVARFRFQETVKLDSNYAMAWWHLAMIAVMANEKDRAEEYLREFLALDNTSFWAEQVRMADSVLFRGVAAKSHVVGSLGQRPLGALEWAAVTLGELNPPPGAREVAREALRVLRQRAARPSDLSLAFRMQLADMLATGRWNSAIRHLEVGARSRVPPDELDRWIVLSAVTSVLPPLADESEQRASVRRLLMAQDDAAEARWLAARWYLQNSPSDAQAAITALNRIALDSSTTSPLARSLKLDIEARQELAAGDSVQADSLWKRATSYYSIDDLIFGRTASLWPLRLERATVLAARGEYETAIQIAETFTQMAGFADQVAWPSVLGSLAEWEVAVDNKLRACEEIYPRLERLLSSSAEGEAVQVLDRARQRRSELCGVLRRPA